MAKHGEPRRTSTRVALEVALLASPSEAGTEQDLDARPRAGAGGGVVLVAAADPDLRRYVRECLRGRPDLHVVEAPTLPLLVIADRADAASDAAPRLRLTDEPGELARPDPGEVLAAPFNAWELLQAVDRLLGRSR